MSSMNSYVVFYATNWPAALLDGNGAAQWPFNYRLAGLFQARDRAELWSILNDDDRPTAGEDRAMCAGDLVIVENASRQSSEARGQVWLAQRLGWVQLCLPSRVVMPLHTPGTRAVQIDVDQPGCRVTDGGRTAQEIRSLGLGWPRLDQVLRHVTVPRGLSVEGSVLAGEISGIWQLAAACCEAIAVASWSVKAKGTA